MQCRLKNEVEYFKFIYLSFLAYGVAETLIGQPVRVSDWMSRPTSTLDPTKSCAKSEYLNSIF
jgi:hypothetical protein